MHERSEATPEALARIDLNLLVAFDALAREGNVTNAAARVGLTQSAMSHALRRLRELFDDPLLVRGRGGMVLTPRAEALATPLRSGLVSVHRALSQHPEFDPGTASRGFRMASPDLFDALVLPSMLARIRAEAPGVDLGVLPVTNVGESLQVGELDVAVLPRFHGAGSEPAALVPGLVRRALFRDRFACMLRADHPALATARGRRRKLSLSAYLKLSHAMVSPSGAGIGPVDRALELQGVQRSIGLRVPSFTVALAVIARSDLVLTAPSGLARLAAPTPGIAVYTPPLSLPEHGVDLVWHERFTNDPGHSWLRTLITEAAQSEMGRP